MLKKMYWGVVGLALIPTQAVFAKTTVEFPLGDSGDGQGFTFESPLKDFGGIQGLLEEILRVIVLIGAPIAVLFIIYSGFLFVTARGNEDQLTKAKKTFLWTVIGTAILLGAQAIASVLGGTVDQITQ